MRRICAVIVLGLFMISGCSYGAQQLKSMMRDPHYAQHQEKMDELEKEYLRGKVTYSQYQEQKKQLEDSYAKEVKSREDTIRETAQ